MSEKMLGVKKVDPRTLKNHSLNITLYGEDIPAHLTDSIKQYGIREPIVVCRSSNMDLDGVVVSGRRRRVAAIKSGIKEVPIVEWKCEDEDELKQELIIRNVRSELTIEQRGRMAAELLEIEKRLAEKRQASGSKQESPGRAIDKAASQVGLAPTTAKRVMQTIKNVDELKGEGQIEKAEAVVATMNKGKVTQALRESAPQAPAKPPEIDPNKEVDDKINLIEKHERLLRAAVVECMLAFDRKHNDDQEFSMFAKFESIMRGISESQERPKIEVARLVKEWKRFVSKSED
ncbi:MAG: hypothetical protein EBW87_02520 [Burkholderiaceae bacterium]|nr:hypothetical protein [Burkholderiaceae bacterium]